ncbi:oligomeric Golgi complex subunit 8 [Kockiozyma suomiensis]|uniref:oligomeric Golgi complex subunit 8 n=1 Tax=Kockiozyma suomiensis TaxID=1337062 RepID=UPI0033433CFF
MDSLIDVISDSIPAEVLEQIQAWHDSDDYFHHLRGLSTESMSVESVQLSSSLQAIDKSLTQLAVQSRPHLISTSSTLESFTQKFESLTIAVPYLSEVVPDLEMSVAHFSPVNDRGASATLLSNVDKILDILELPTLILTCVRNGYYAEALDLVGHVRRLTIRYRNAKVLMMIQNEVENALLEMTTLLLKLLRENVQLPTAIKVISYLKRLQPFQSSANSTLELQHIYLLSRSIHLRSQLKSLEPLQSLPEKYLKKYIECFREFVFAAVVGFRSIFPKEGASIIDDSEIQTQPPFSSFRKGVLVDGGEQLLSSFIFVVTADLKRTIDSFLPLISDRSTYSSLYLQTIYASQSLARIGGEFWGILAGDSDSQYQAMGDSGNPWITALEKQRDLAKKLKPF